LYRPELPGRSLRQIARPAVILEQALAQVLLVSIFSRVHLWHPEELKPGYHRLAPLPDTDSDQTAIFPAGSGDLEGLNAHVEEFARALDDLAHNTDYDDYGPRANRLPDGNVLLTWEGDHAVGYEIYYAVLDSAGNVAHPVTRLTDVPYGAYDPDAVGLRNGKAIVAWEQDGYYPNWSRQMAYAVLDDVYYTPTAPITTPTIITNTLSNDNRYVSLARDEDDNTVLTWRDSNVE